MYQQYFQLQECHKGPKFKMVISVGDIISDSRINSKMERVLEIRFGRVKVLVPPYQKL